MLLVLFETILDLWRFVETSVDLWRLMIFNDPSIQGHICIKDIQLN